MLRLAHRPKLGADAIPAHLTTLSVSWLNNQFKAISIHRGRVVASWERPGETDGPAGFDGFIREAVQQTGYQGQTVSLVLAHPRLVQQLIDVPPVKGTPLSKVIQRQAQNQKLFPGEAAWASQSSPSRKGAPRVVLHLFPKLLLNQFIQGCKRNDLDLTAVLPPSAVLHHQLTQLPLQKDELALLAAEAGESTTLVIGRSDGQILLARALPGTWNVEPERLALDLNRTILFVNQQYGVSINQGVWLFGPGAAEKLKILQERVQYPVKLSPIAYEPFYWATEAVKLRPEVTPNLVDPLLQKAPQRRIFAKVVATATALVLAASLGASAYFHLQAQRTAANATLLSNQLAKLEARKSELMGLDAELSRKEQVLQLVVGDRPPPEPAWLLAYLGEAVPPDLVVTNLEIQRVRSFYRMRIAGALQQAVKAPTSPPLSHSLALLQARLSDGPFYVRLDEPEVKTNPVASAGGLGRTNSSVPDWISQFARNFNSDLDSRQTPGEEDQFLIQGVMR